MMKGSSCICLQLLMYTCNYSTDCNYIVLKCYRIFLCYKKLSFTCGDWFPSIIPVLAWRGDDYRFVRVAKFIMACWKKAANRLLTLIFFHLAVFVLFILIGKILIHYPTNIINLWWSHSRLYFWLISNFFFTILMF